MTTAHTGDLVSLPATLVDAYLMERMDGRRIRPPLLRSMEAGRNILEQAPEVQVQVLREALHRVDGARLAHPTSYPYLILDLASALAVRPLPYSDEDMQAILNVLLANRYSVLDSTSLMHRVLRSMEPALLSRPLSTETRRLLEIEQEKVRGHRGSNEFGRVYALIGDILYPADSGMPEPGEPWALSMLSTLREMDSESLSKWQQLLIHASHAEPSKPPAKWMREAAALVQEIGYGTFKAQVLSWFEGLQTPYRLQLSTRNGTLVKGLAWACGAYDDPDLAAALGRLVESMLHWIPEWPAMDWRCLRAGNAAAHALGVMPGDEPIAQLSRLSLRLKGKQVQDTIGKALTAATERRGMLRADLEEMTVPTHDLDSDSCLTRDVGDARAIATATDLGTVDWFWMVDGKRQKSVPAAVKTLHADALKSLKQDVESMRTSLSAQRARLEGLLLSRRSWRFADWQERYLDHPLLAPMVRNLIWLVRPAEAEPGTVMFVDGQFRNCKGQSIGDLSPETVVQLWHPLETEPETASAWRDRLHERQLQQPFKQAARELYFPRQDEDPSAMASTRFAGQVLQQGQFTALAVERGWQYKLQGHWTHQDQQAIRELPDWRLRAEFEVAPKGEMRSLFTSRFAHPFVLTGSVRFTRPAGAPQRLGNGQPETAIDALPTGPLRLRDVPAIVFSEVMRDLDLFVSVAASTPTGDIRQGTAEPTPRRGNRQQRSQVTRQLAAPRPDHRG